MRVSFFSVHPGGTKGGAVNVADRVGIQIIILEIIIICGIIII